MSLFFFLPIPGIMERTKVIIASTFLDVHKTKVPLILPTQRYPQLAKAHHQICSGDTVVILPRLLAERDEDALGACEDRKGNNHRSSAEEQGPPLMSLSSLCIDTPVKHQYKGPLPP